MRTPTGLPGGGFYIPEFQAAIDVRSTIAGQRVSPQMWQVGDGESPTWMYRTMLPVTRPLMWDETNNTVLNQANLATTIVQHDIDVKVKRRIDIGSHDLEFQIGIPVCDTEALQAEDLTKVAAMLKVRLHLRMLARTGPGN